MNKIEIRGDDATMYDGRYMAWSVYENDNLMAKMFGPTSASAALVYAKALRDNKNRPVVSLMELPDFTK